METIRIIGQISYILVRLKIIKLVPTSPKLATQEVEESEDLKDSKEQGQVVPIIYSLLHGSPLEPK